MKYQHQLAMPDLKGMNASQAKTALKEKNLNINIEGKGVVCFTKTICSGETSTRRNYYKCNIKTKRRWRTIKEANFKPLYFYFQ